MNEIIKVMKKIIIVGSGIVGSAIAYELSNNSEFDITLIDEKIQARGQLGRLWEF